jgi:hypothetical protein
LRKAPATHVERWRKQSVVLRLHCVIVWPTVDNEVVDLEDR